MESKFSKEEIEQIREKMNRISDRIPENMARWVWGTYKRIKVTEEKQPCMCNSAARHWRKAVDTINTFLKQYDK
tara:strand:+ start:1831 stop:2052 length:222 start_codon:yes stop_codon:yes gene_type:complete